MVDFIRNIFQAERRSFYAIAALLDDKHNAIVYDIWNELEAELGIEHLFNHPVPHVTHVQAQDIDTDLFADALEQFALQQPPFKVRTAGLGIFTGEQNAVYVSIVRNPELSRVQTTLIGSLVGATEGISQHNYINFWMPHISLIIPGMADNQLPDVVRLLAKRNFSWEVDISEFIVLDGTDNPRDTMRTVKLQGIDA